MRKIFKSFIKTYFRNKIYFTIFLILFVFMLFSRFYGLESKSPFGYDQVDNAWAAKNIIVDGKLPLVGMQAKVSSGLYIGPFYYYLITPFYLLTNLDPIASIFIAGFTSIFSFFIIYFTVRSLFNEKIAVIALFINTLSSYVIELDRVQWPVNFIVPLSFLIILSLYKIYTDNPKYYLLLTLSLGFSLHIHFTSVFYFIIIILTLPFLPRTKKSLKYILLSIPIFLIFIFPIVLHYVITNSGSFASSYLGNSYHGFHLRRFLQLIGDDFIEFNALLSVPKAIYFSVPAFIIFITLFFRDKLFKSNKILIYMILIWMLVPWIAFTTYSGEITNYYFGITRPIAIITISYLIYRLFTLKRRSIKLILVIFAFGYAGFNINNFFVKSPVGLTFHRKAVQKKISNGEKIEFVKGDPQSYIYYVNYQYKNEY